MTNNPGRLGECLQAIWPGELGVYMWVCHPLYHPSPPFTLSTPTLPACNVTIHNRCKDTLANCTKVKQKVS